MRRRPITRAHLALAIAAALIASPCAAVTSTPELPADLARALNAFNRATMRKDTTTLATLVADDYLLVNSDSSVQDKASYLSDLEKQGFRIDPYVIEQPAYRARGEAALTTGILDLGWTQDGRHQRRRVRIAHLWTKQDGRWRIGYTQLTRVPE